MTSASERPSASVEPRTSTWRRGSQSPQRELAVDLARGVALISMFVAHTAPSPGPFDVLVLSEFLTFPLFALLVGIGAALGAREYAPVPHLVRSVVSAGALLGLGWMLAQAGAYVVIVLGQLGILTLVMWVVVRLRSVVVAAIGLLAAAVAPWTLSASADLAMRFAMEGDTLAAWWLQQWVSSSYPQAVLVSLGCLGVLGARYVLLVPTKPSTAALASAGSVLLLGAAGLLVADRARTLDIEPYRTAPAEQILVAALATGVALWCVVLARGPWRVWQVGLGVVASAGAMTLTLYSLHIVWLAYWVVEFRPGEGDDTWVNVVGMTVAALVLGAAWRALRLPRPWGRGPVEGVVTLVADLLATPWGRAGRGDSGR